MTEYVATIAMFVVGSGLLLGFRLNVMNLAKLSEKPRTRPTPEST